MWRLTKLPELKKVNCSHSGSPDVRIILFGVFVLCRRGPEEYKLYRINKNIGRENRSFKMILLEKDEGEDQMIEAEQVQLKSLNLQINYSFLELVWIFFVNISLIGLMAAILPKIYRFYPSSVYIEMTITVLICSCAALVFNLLLTKVYQWMLLAELKQQTKMNSKYEKIFFITIKVYYVISILVSFLFGLYVGFQNTRQKNIETYQWVCIIFCATGLFAFVWEVLDNICNCCSKRRAPTEGSEEEKTVSSMGSTY